MRKYSLEIQLVQAWGAQVRATKQESPRSDGGVPLPASEAPREKGEGASAPQGDEINQAPQISALIALYQAAP